MQFWQRVCSQLLPKSFLLLLLSDSASECRARVLVRFAGNEKGVTFQTEQTLTLLKNADVLMNDAELWKMIAARFLDDSSESIWQIGALDGRIQNRSD